jgi:hypothetical protein
LWSHRYELVARALQPVFDMNNWILAQLAVLISVFVPLGLSAAESTRFNLVHDKDGGPRILIQCSYSKQAAECRVDTGSKLVIVEENETTLSLPKLSTASFAGLGDKSVSCDVVRIGELKVGSLDSTQAIAMRCRKASRLNVVGTSYLLRNRYLSFDFSNSTMSFNSFGKLDQSAPKLEIDSGGFIKIPVTIGSTTLSAAFDTGADSSVVSNGWMKKNQALARFKTEAIKFDLLGNKLNFKVFETDHFIIAGHDLGLSEFWEGR